MADGRQEQHARPAGRAGLHPQGPERQVEEPGEARLAARRGGPKGQRRPSARQDAARPTPLRNARRLPDGAQRRPYTLRIVARQGRDAQSAARWSEAQ